MTQQVERMLPLYEGKMGWQYDHRAATFIGVGDTDTVPNLDHSAPARVHPRYWVREEVVRDRLDRRTWGTDSALLGFRRVARNTDERTVIASMIPWGAASYGWILSAGPNARDLALLLAQYNSFAFDYVLRQFLSQPSVPQGTFSQLPILPPTAFAELDATVGDGAEWVIRRVALLAGAGEEMTSLARALGLDDAAPWSEDLRRSCRAELDAAMFHLFGIRREDLEYVMDSFNIIKRKDLAVHGTYRTKDLILSIYDEIHAALVAGTEYRSSFEQEQS